MPFEDEILLEGSFNSISNHTRGRALPHRDVDAQKGTSGEYISQFHT